jgi:hypothetical protein
LGNIVMVLNKGLENILIVKVLLIKQLGWMEKLIKEDLLLNKD